jgi:mitochondrial import receptor subunit TOM40
MQPRNPASVACSAEYFGKSFSAGTKVSNDGFMTGTFVQRITPNLVGAVEAFRHPRITGMHFAAQYSALNYTAYAMYASYGAFSMSYLRKVSPRVALASAFQSNGGQSLFEFGYNFNLKFANVKARVDSHGVVGCVLEEKLAPGFSLLLSGAIDHSADPSKGSGAKFGVGLNMG